MTCCCHRLTQERARVIWRRESQAEVDWMGEQTRAGVYPEGPYTRPCPEMTVPPPFSPEWYHLPGSEKR